MKNNSAFTPLLKKFLVSIIYILSFICISYFIGNWIFSMIYKYEGFLVRENENFFYSINSGLSHFDNLKSILPTIISWIISLITLHIMVNYICKNFDNIQIKNMILGVMLATISFFISYFIIDITKLIMLSSVITCLFLILLNAIIIYGVLLLLKKYNFHKKTVIISSSIVFSILFIIFLLFNFDVFMLQYKTPKTQEIESVVIEGNSGLINNMGGGAYHCTENFQFNDEFFFKVTFLREEINLYKKAHKDIIKIQKKGTNFKLGDTMLTITYKLKNNEYFIRRYNVDNNLVDDISKVISPLRSRDISNYERYKNLINDNDTLKVLDTENGKVYDVKIDKSKLSLEKYLKNEKEDNKKINYIILSPSNKNLNYINHRKSSYAPNNFYNLFSTQIIIKESYKEANSYLKNMIKNNSSIGEVTNINFFNDKIENRLYNSYCGKIYTMAADGSNKHIENIQNWNYFKNIFKNVDSNSENLAFLVGLNKSKNSDYNNEIQFLPLQINDKYYHSIKEE